MSPVLLFTLKVQPKTSSTDSTACPGTRTEHNTQVEVVDRCHVPCYVHGWFQEWLWSCQPKEGVTSCISSAEDWNKIGQHAMIPLSGLVQYPCWVTEECSRVGANWYHERIRGSKWLVLCPCERHAEAWAEKYINQSFHKHMHGQ